MFHLNKVRYKNILSITNLSIEENKVTSIVGESGSGKTTFMKLLNKLISADEGDISFNGTSLKDISSIDLRRKVVMLPQSPAIFAGTVRDNLLIGLRFSEKSIVLDDELKEILKSVHLNKSLDEDSEKLSGGEKQRLALGRVLLMKPEVLLLDEPSSALDEDTEELIIRHLVNYTRQSNKTLIMVTHSKKIAKSFSDVIIEIKKGSIVDKGEGNNE